MSPPRCKKAVVKVANGDITITFTLTKDGGGWKVTGN
jgi:hypothetical protein